MSHGAKIVSLSETKKAVERKRYAALVMAAYDDMEHADKRAMLDRRAKVQIEARERL